MSQLHKKFNDDQVKSLLKRYLNKEIKRKYIQEILGIGKTRFFALLKTYQNNPKKFSITYNRESASKISKTAEKAITNLLKADKRMIKNAAIPIWEYNYSHLRDCLADDHNEKVSVTTIIKRAQEPGFYLPRKPKKKLHDREVLTDHAGELIQHDSSLHLFAPAAKEKWYLITSLDDFSRFILYAILLAKEYAWAHIQALQTVFLKYGCPLRYYVDQDSIFRFVKGRDYYRFKEHYKQTDDTTPQWRHVLNDCNVQVTFALFPQAKGKIERPYGWLQDRLVRMCVRENVTDVNHGNRVLNRILHRYNYKQIHSTTEEVPHYRLQRAFKEKLSLFRPFIIPAPFQTVKDIFCLRTKRTFDTYRKISVNNLPIKVKNAVPREQVELRIYPLTKTFSEVRFWCNNKLIDVQKFRIPAMQSVHF